MTHWPYYLLGCCGAIYLLGWLLAISIARSAKRADERKMEK